MNVPCQAAEKDLIAPILPQSRQDTLLPHLRSRSIGLLTYQPVRCSVHAPVVLAGKQRVLARLGREGEITGLFEQTELYTYGFHVHFG